MPTQEVVIKKIPVQTVASVRDTVTISGVSQLFGELFGYLGQHGFGPAGPPIGIYYDEEFREDGIDAEIAAPVAGSVPEGGRIKVRELPAVNRAASIIHEGSYEDIRGTYGQLLKWIESNGYRITGPVREVYVQGPESGRDPSDYVTELQFPVEQV